MIRSASERMVKKGLLTEFYLNLADQIPPFEVGDYVRIKDVKMKDKILARHTNTYICKIQSIEGERLRLDDIEGDFVLEDVEAIPLDGVHDANIYYDPIITASFIGPGQTLPTRHIDYTYFIHKFEDYFYNGKSYADYVREQNLHFVHEVQHWLREVFHKDDLKVRLNFAR